MYPYPEGNFVESFAFLKSVKCLMLEKENEL